MKKKFARRTKIIIGIMVLAILFPILNACSVEKEPIKIGVVGTMTGTQSDLSVSGRRGIEIAVDNINKNHGINGHQIELVVKNDENNPKRAEQIVQEFVDEGVEIVIGHYTSGMMRAAYDKLIESDILYIGPTISADSFSGINDNFLQFIASTKEQAAIINEVAMSNNHKNFIIIYDEKNISFNEALIDNFRQLLESNNGHVIEVIGYEVVDAELKTKVIDSINNKSKEVDAIFVISDANDLAYVAQEIKKNEIACELYGSLWAHTNDLLRVGGNSVEGIRVVNTIDSNCYTEEYLGFSDQYLQRYGNESSFSSVYSYEIIMVLNEVFSLSDKDLSYVDIKNEITNKSFKGLQSDLFINENGDINRPYSMDQIINNEYKRID